MGVLEELADKYGGLISDLRFDYKRREAAMMDLLAMQLQKNSTVDREQREAMLYLFGFPWRKEGNCIGVENFEGILAQMTVIGYSDKEACAYLIDEEGAYYRWSCPYGRAVLSQCTRRWRKSQIQSVADNVKG